VETAPLSTHSLVAVVVAVQLVRELTLRQVFGVVVVTGLILR
jgi:hypothetical protein